MGQDINESKSFMIQIYLFCSWKFSVFSLGAILPSWVLCRYPFYIFFVSNLATFFSQWTKRVVDYHLFVAMFKEHKNYIMSFSDFSIKTKLNHSL